MTNFYFIPKFKKAKQKFQLKLHTEKYKFFRPFFSIIFSPKNDFLHAELHTILNFRNLERSSFLKNPFFWLELFEKLNCFIGINSGNLVIFKKLECSPISKFLSFKMIWSSPFIKIIFRAKFCTKVPSALKNAVIVNSIIGKK